MPSTLSTASARSGVNPSDGKSIVDANESTTLSTASTRSGVNSPDAKSTVGANESTLSTASARSNSMNPNIDSSHSSVGTDSDDNPLGTNRKP